jgi:hypothetical protein
MDEINNQSLINTMYLQLVQVSVCLKFGAFFAGLFAAMPILKPFL